MRSIFKTSGTVSHHLFSPTGINVVRSLVGSVWSTFSLSTYLGFSLSRSLPRALNLYVVGLANVKLSVFMVGVVR